MTVSTTGRTLALLSFLMGMWGCYKPELPAYVHLRISNSTLPDAKLGLDYDTTLIAEGGQPPITWSLSAKPGSLDWLILDSVTGKLSGVPNVKVSPGEPFFIRAVDARGEAAEKTMTLQALECIGTEETTCYRFDATAQQCQKSSVLCAGGRFPDCGSGPASTELDRCGPSASGPGCGSCGSSGDACDGVCKCGGHDACSGITPDCCNGSCTSIQTDSSNCGACGTVCPDSKRPFTHAVCAGGACTNECDSGYTKCDRSCVDTNSDSRHCGGCDLPCTDGTCADGQCLCPTGFHYCKGTGCIPIRRICLIRL